MRAATRTPLAALGVAALVLASLLPSACSSPIEEDLDTAALEMRQGSYEHAIAIYEGVLQRVPDAPNIHNNLGYALAQMGRYEEAVVHFEAAAARSGPAPLQATLLHNWAHALEKLGRLDEAAERYAQAAKADPARADVFLGWGNVLAGLGRLDEAAHRYRQGVDINPESAIGWFNLGRTLERLERADEALACFRTFLTLQGDVPSNVMEHARRFVAQADAARQGTGDL